MSLGNTASCFNPAELTFEKDFRLSLQTGTVIGNEVIPVAEMFREGKGSYYNGNSTRFKGTASINTDIKWENFGASYFRYAQALIISSGDTVRLIQDIQNDTSRIGSTYEVTLAAEQMYLEGIKLSIAHSISSAYFKGLSLGAALNLMNGLEYNNGTLAGEATSTTLNDYQYSFDLYAHGGAWYRDPKFMGQGYGLDLGAIMEVSDELRLNLTLQNVLGKMFWRGVDYTEAQGESNSVSFDAEGHIINHPTISGRESTTSVEQTLLNKTVLGLTYDRGDFLFAASLEPYANTTYFNLGGQWKISDDLCLRGGYNSNYAALTLGIGYKHFNATLLTDNLNLNQASSLGIAFQVL